MKLQHRKAAQQCSISSIFFILLQSFVWAASACHPLAAGLSVVEPLAQVRHGGPQLATRDEAVAVAVEDLPVQKSSQEYGEKNRYSDRTRLFAGVTRMLTFYYRVGKTKRQKEGLVWQLVCKIITCLPGKECSSSGNRIITLLVTIYRALLKPISEILHSLLPGLESFN